jgi:hypothetical protein
LGGARRPGEEKTAGGARNKTVENLENLGETMSSTTTQPIFSIDSDYVIGHDNLVFMSILHKEYRLKTAMDIENHPRISHEISKRWRLIDTHKHYIKTDNVVYDLEIRKYKSSWILITRSKTDGKPILLKLIRQKIQRIQHPCFTGRCNHISEVI